MKASGKGNCGDEESSPLMLIEDEAVVNVRDMYYTIMSQSQSLWVILKLVSGLIRVHTSSTSS